MGNKNYKQDIIPGIVLVVFAAAYLAMIPTIKPFKGLGSTPLTNQAIPTLWGSVLLFLGAWILVRGIRKRKKFIAEGGVPTKGGNFLKDEREVIWSFLAMAIYVALMEPLGFIISTILYVTVQILFLTPTDKWKKTIVPALITAVIAGVLLDYIFKIVLHVVLPTGILGW